MPKKTPESSATLPSEPSAELSFDAAMQELEEIVQRIESGELSLEASVDAYKRGATLVKRCRDTLAKVEQQVSVLEGDLLKPMEGQFAQGDDGDGADD